MNKQKVENWATAANMRVVAYIESDHWLYWIQPWLIYEHERGLAHKFAQAVSLLLGIPCTLIGSAAWWPLSRIFAVFTKSKPTQAAFVLKKGRVRLNGFRFGTMTGTEYPNVDLSRRSTDLQLKELASRRSMPQILIFPQKRKRLKLVTNCSVPAPDEDY